MPAVSQHMNTRMLKRIGVASIAVLALGGTAVAVAAPWNGEDSERLRDLRPATADATDGARAHLSTDADNGTTTYKFKVTGLDHAAVGRIYGAHVHTGTCTAGDGTAAGPHYNAGGGINNATEVWLDFKVDNGGVGTAETKVPFVIPTGGAHAVVIHDLPTDPATGKAGDRIACLAADF